MRPAPSTSSWMFALWIALACCRCSSADAPDATVDATTGAEAGDAQGPDDAPMSSAADASGATSSMVGSTTETAVCTPECADGSHCELVQVTCIRAPCPPLAMCRPDAAAVSCDPVKILCRRAAPQCPEGQVPSVSGSCYGPCVHVEMCACSREDECPDRDSYTCHKSAGHCGPYV